MFQKLRVQFLIVFIGYSIVNLLVLMYFFKLEREKNIIDSIENKVNQIAILAFQDSKILTIFLPTKPAATTTLARKKALTLVSIPQLLKH